jgi:hypothetical protein
VGPAGLKPAETTTGIMPVGRTDKMSMFLCTCDFDFVKDISLNGANLFQTNQLKKREKRYD